MYVYIHTCVHTYFLISHMHVPHMYHTCIILYYNILSGHSLTEFQTQRHNVYGAAPRDKLSTRYAENYCY